MQGSATCPDEIVTSVLRARELWKRIFDRQPSSVAYSKCGITRRMMDVYYMRLLITVTPTVIRAVPALEASGPLSVARDRDRGVQDPFASAVNRLPQFDSAVLTAFDEQGSPTLLRVRPTVDHASRSVGIDTDSSLQPGKARSCATATTRSCGTCAASCWR